MNNKYHQNCQIVQEEKSYPRNESLYCYDKEVIITSVEKKSKGFIPFDDISNSIRSKIQLKEKPANSKSPVCVCSKVNLCRSRHKSFYLMDNERIYSGEKVSNESVSSNEEHYKKKNRMFVPRSHDKKPSREESCQYFTKPSLATCQNIYLRCPTYRTSNERTIQKIRRLSHENESDIASCIQNKCCSQGRTTKKVNFRGKRDVSSERRVKNTRLNSEEYDPSVSIHSERHLHQSDEERREQTRSISENSIYVYPRKCPCRPRSKSLYCKEIIASNEKVSTGFDDISNCICSKIKPKEEKCKEKLPSSKIPVRSKVNLSSHKSFYLLDNERTYSGKKVSNESVSCNEEFHRKNKKVFVRRLYDNRPKLYPQDDDTERFPSYRYYTPLNQVSSSDDMVDSLNEAQSRGRQYLSLGKASCRRAYEDKSSRPKFQSENKRRYQPSGNYSKGNAILLTRKRCSPPNEDEKYEKQDIAKASMQTGISEKVCFPCDRELNERISRANSKMNDSFNCTVCAKELQGTMIQSKYEKCKQCYKDKYNVSDSTSEAQTETVKTNRKYRIRSKSPEESLRIDKTSSNVTVTSRGKPCIRNINDKGKIRLRTRLISSSVTSNVTSTVDVTSRRRTNNDQQIPSLTNQKQKPNIRIGRRNCSQRDETSNISDRLRKEANSILRKRTTNQVQKPTTNIHRINSSQRKEHQGSSTVPNSSMYFKNLIVNICKETISNQKQTPVIRIQQASLPVSTRRKSGTNNQQVLTVVPCTSRIKTSNNNSSYKQCSYKVSSNVTLTLRRKTNTENLTNNDQVSRKPLFAIRIENATIAKSPREGSNGIQTKLTQGSRILINTASTSRKCTLRTIEEDGNANIMNNDSTKEYLYRLRRDKVPVQSRTKNDTKFSTPNKENFTNNGLMRSKNLCRIRIENGTLAKPARKGSNGIETKSAPNSRTLINTVSTLTISDADYRVTSAPNESNKKYFYRLRRSNVPVQSRTINDTSPSHMFSTLSCNCSRPTRIPRYSSSEDLFKYQATLEEFNNYNRRLCHRMDALCQSPTVSNIMKNFSDRSSTSTRPEYGQFYPYKSHSTRFYNQPRTQQIIVSTASYPFICLPTKKATCLEPIYENNL